jgi:hypothetical protein
MVTVFRGVIEFLGKIGIYDVVLPFLLVFSVIFAILEKTKVLGTEKIGEETYTKKNLNAMTAFVTGFLVVASTSIVEVVNESVAHIAVLAIAVVCFLLLIGIFYSEDEHVILEGKWRNFFMVLMFIAVLLIFFAALNWLEPFWNYLVDHWDTSWVGTVILLVIIILCMVYITHDHPQPKKEKTEG